MSEQTTRAAERFGSRWLHAHPSEQQVKEWFDSQNLHPGMPHEPYYGGIVLIGAKEKVNVTVDGNQGPYLREVEQAVYVPYVKVDTRIAYFWDLIRHLNGGEEGDALGMDGDYYGTIRAVPQRVIEDPTSPYFNANLPEGFTLYPVKVSDQNVSRYLVATFEVTIRHRQSDRVILRGRGSKQTAMKRQYPDDNAIMKAETGAIGRALGVGGILVVGTGVATAEDMQEAMATTPAGATPATGPEGATLPAGDAPTVELESPVAAEAITPDSMGSALPDGDEDLRKMANGLRVEMQSLSPDAWQAYTAWWSERFPDQTLDQVTGPALRGAVIKLQRDLDGLVRGAQT